MWILVVLGGLLIVAGTILLVFAKRLANLATRRIQERNRRASPWLWVNPWDFSVQAFRLRGGGAVFGGVLLVIVGISLNS